MSGKLRLRINGKKQNDKDKVGLWLTRQGRTADLFAGIEASAVEIAGSARGSGEDLVEEIPDGALVEVELDGGLRFWTSAEDLRTRLSPQGTEARGLDDGEAWSLPDAIGLPGAQRGFAGKLALKALHWLNIKPDDALRDTIVERVQNRTIPREGVFPVHADGTLGQPLDKPIPDGGPTLLLLHGTGSSTAGSFGRLWQDQKERWQALREHYGERIYALEHWTLTRSPIDNALTAARLLPRKGRISFLSHSRGGLVGELLCLDPDRFELAEALRSLAPGLAEDASQKQAKENQCEALRALVDELQGRPELSIDRFVRAACPARGTSLAGDKLDQWGSLMVLAAIGLEMKAGESRGFEVPGLLQTGLDMVTETVASVLASRRRVDQLPGLQAMLPGSALVGVINAAPARGELYVIAGDAAPMEGDRFAALRIWLTDRFYERDHDLVVDTRSMLDGAIRRTQDDELRCRVHFRSGADVNHFRYFRNDDSAAATVAALTHAPEADRLFRNYHGEWPLPDLTGEQARGLFGPRVQPDPAKPRGTVVLVPGLCGSQLLVNKSEVWASILSLASGAFSTKLGIKDDVQPGLPLADTYVPLANSLRQRGYKVDMYGYDWRQPLANSIKGLAERITAAIKAMEPERKPVHIVVHSMGGVLLRATFAAHPDLWRAWDAHPGAPRVLMLGTPNQGSHAITLLLTGRDSFFRKLALLDVFHSQEELLQTACQFPGVMELLPWATSGDDQHIRNADTWHNFKQGDANAKWPEPPADVLNQSGAIWETLAQSDPLLSSPRLVYVAGLADQTPEKALVDASGRFQILATPAGDGRVPWSTGIPDSCRKGGRVYYVRSVHGDMPKATEAHDGYVELLETGRSDRLATQPPVSRGTAALQPWRLDEGDTALYPSRGELLSAATGGALRSARKTARSGYRTEVRVLHGDVMYAESAVLVGHTWGANALEFAEKLLDQALGGRMQKRLDAGLHAGALGTFSIYRKRPNESFTQGAIVIGIGRIGQLSAGELAQSVAKAVATYATEELEAEELKDPAERQQPLSVGISALLIGAGIGELSLADSVAATLRGHRDARLRLERAGLAGKLRLDRLNFIEVLEDRAINALRAAQDSVGVDRALARAFYVDAVIRPHHGGRRRASSAADEGNWQRIAISAVGGTNDGAPRLMFDVYGELARAERTYNAVPFKDIERFTDSLIGTTADQEQVGRALFELLIPNWLKDLAPDRRRVQLIVDKTAAAYPWELLRDRATEHDSDSGQPLSVRSGLIRQLSTGQFRLNVRRSNAFKALVVGNPDLGAWHRYLPSLSGAEKEAQGVSGQFDGAGIETSLHIQDESRQILLDLFSGEWRMLHLSGHGLYQQDIPATDGLPAVAKATGMVIGGGDLLTTAHIEQMRAVPDFVFINCCSLGRIEERPDGAPAAARPGSPGLAANLATQLIEIGVRCVIAAGWEVLDDAAELFAKTFYEHFLEGANFGESVLAARGTTFDAFGSSNTWGAYQCYGDPGFVLPRPQRTTTPKAKPANYDHYLAASEVLCELERLTLRAGHALTLDKDAAAYAERHAKALQALCEQQGWIGQGNILEAFGALKAEYNRHDEAIDFYRRALAAPDASASRKAEEQLANMLTRRAKVLADDKQTAAALPLLDEAAAILAVDSRYRPASAERLSLQAAADKRRLACQLQIGDKAAAIEALESMQDAYKRATAQARQEGGDLHYPALNAANASALLGLTAGFPDGEPAATRALLKSLREQPATPAKDFWARASQADLHLADGLLELAAGGRSGAKRLGEAKAAYVALVSSGATPRERESVASTIDILLQALQKLDAAAGREQAVTDAIATLGEIQAALST
ncbi:MAG: CHAT domain-containing protein [Proteobacteria bacterium]|nr:CHAT domain-containing protein [Pseudomonadota bacterium]